MERTVPEVFDDALALSEEDRARLVAKLVESMDGEADEGVEDSWGVEIQHRIAKIEAGEATLVSMDDALARMRRAAQGR